VGPDAAHCNAVAYHEGFWVAAATAAPVIGLAHGLVAGRMIVRVVPAIGLVRAMRELWWLRTLRTMQLISPYLVAGVGFLLCWVAFQDAMDCLRSGSDSHPLHTTEGNLSWAFFLLMCQLIAVGVAKGAVGWLRGRGPKPPEPRHRRGRHAAAIPDDMSPTER